MERLAEIIGPAPSELPWEEALHRVMEERERVRGELEWFRGAGSKASFRGSKGGSKGSKGSKGLKGLKGSKSPTKVQKRKVFVQKMDAFSGDPDVLLELMKKAMEEASDEEEGK